MPKRAEMKTEQLHQVEPSLSVAMEGQCVWSDTLSPFSRKLNCPQLEPGYLQLVQCLDSRTEWFSFPWPTSPVCVIENFRELW